MTELPRAVTRVPLGPDLELQVQAVAGDSERPQLDVRIARRDGAPQGTPGAAYRPTPAGFRIPLHLVPVVAEAITKAARRGAEHGTACPLDVRGDGAA